MPEETFETPQSVPEPKTTNWPRIILAAVLGVGLLVSAAYAGYWYGTENSKFKTQSAKLPSETQPLQTPTLTPTQTPTAEATPTPSPAPIQVPNDWQEFTDEDADFGIRTTLSLPPKYIFSFSGSEWTIYTPENYEALWDYSTSVFRGKEEEPRNYYDGGSRRQWYQRYLNGEFSINVPRVENDEVVNVVEHSIGASTYLEVDVKRVSTGNLEKHYLYVQNGILNVIRPASHATEESADFVINKKINIIFTSLSTVQTK